MDIAAALFSFGVLASLMIYTAYQFFKGGEAARNAKALNDLIKKEKHDEKTIQRLHDLLRGYSGTLVRSDAAPGQTAQESASGAD